MADLPEISQNLDEPLPQVDPGSAMVPYRMARSVPGGQPVVTTGYGPRARPPIQPPEAFGGGVGMPSLDQVYQSAFSQLPVEEAVKAVEAATRYVAQRGYQRDIQGGADPIKTFAKYAPLMFKQATGLPEVFQAQMQQAKMAQPTIHQAGGGLYRIPQTGPAETLVAPKPPAPKLHFNNTTGEVVQENPDGTLKKVREGTPKLVETSEVKDAYKQLDEARKDMAKLVSSGPKTRSKEGKKEHQSAIDDATMRMRDARVTIANFNPTAPATPVPAGTPSLPNPAQTKANPYKVGAQYGKLKYKGGDPNLETSWEPVK